MTVEEAIRSNISIAGTLRSLGRACVGTNYRWLKNEANRLNISLSHFSKEFNLDYRTVLRLLKKQKKYQSHKGWKFKSIVEI